jgi:hypothetical protein
MEQSCTLAVRCKPNARKNRIVSVGEKEIGVAVAAQPQDGKANRELIDFLAETLGVRKSALEIIRGHTAKTKFISLTGTNKETALKILETKRNLP